MKEISTEKHQVTVYYCGENFIVATAYSVQITSICQFHNRNFILYTLLVDQIPNYKMLLNNSVLVNSLTVYQTSKFVC